MYRSIAKRQMKKVVFNYLVVAVIAVLAVLTSCSGPPTMKGTTYVNSNAENKPMTFTTGTVGVFDFVDDNNVNILFPYAIDIQMESGIKISSEMRISGEYKRSRNTITIRFKLKEDQEEPGVLEVEVKDDGKTLLGKQGEVFNKIEK